MEISGVVVEVPTTKPLCFAKAVICDYYQADAVSIFVQVEGEGEGV